MRPSPMTPAGPLPLIPVHLLPEDLFERWGFEYKGILVWVKPGFGIGNYWRVAHEFLLLGVRGSAPFLDHRQLSWVISGRGEHSEKPEITRKLIELVSPGPYLELFGRKEVPGWMVLGDQIGSGDGELFDQL